MGITFCMSTLYRTIIIQWICPSGATTAKDVMCKLLSKVFPHRIILLSTKPSKIRGQWHTQSPCSEQLAGYLLVMDWIVIFFLIRINTYSGYAFASLKIALLFALVAMDLKKSVSLSCSPTQCCSFSS